MHDIDITRSIASMTHRYQYGSLSPAVVRMAKWTILDFVGCMIRGVREPCSLMLFEELFGGREPLEESTVLNLLRESTARSNNAMLYATAAHSIDFDDTHPVPAHVGSPVIAAVLSLAPGLASTGQDIVEAVVSGYEAAVRVGNLLSGEHYQRGFHTTGTVSIFGAAAASGKLLGLDPAQLQSAIGIAATQASGVKASFGTMTKPLNAGHAASGGVIAARLAHRGFTAPQDSLENDRGFLALYNGLPASDRVIAPPTDFLILDNLFKSHAACHVTHAMAEAILELVSDNSINGATVANIQIRTCTLAIKTASVVRPKTGLESKFCFHHVAALAIDNRDMTSEDAFSEQAINNEVLQSLREKVAIDIDDSLTVWQSRVEIVLESGVVLSVEHDLGKSATKPATMQARLVKKFASNCQGVLTPRRSHQLSESLLALDTVTDCNDLLMI